MIPAEHLGGTFEVAELLGCARQQIPTLRQREDFPKPEATLRATPVWDLRKVSEFKRGWTRRA